MVLLLILLWVPHLECSKVQLKLLRVHDYNLSTTLGHTKQGVGGRKKERRGADSLQLRAPRSMISRYVFVLRQEKSVYADLKKVEPEGEFKIFLTGMNGTW